MRQYWVVGGEYKSTKFKSIAEGSEEVRTGPFSTYDEALKDWQRLAWETVDNAYCHFHIVEDDVAEPTKTTYWVVGGNYADSSFKTLSGTPDRFGPFDTKEEAENKWQEMAWKTVDDATAMYRIETLRPTVDEAEDKDDDKLAYRLITGPDDQAFCERVSKALSEGYVLYGSPAISTSKKGTVVAQAVILTETA